MATSSLCEFRQSTSRAFQKKENVANTRREKTTTIHAIVSAMATGGCSYAPLRRTRRTEKKRKKDRRRRAARRITRRQRTQWVRQWLLRRPMHGQYEKLMHGLTTEGQSGFKNFLRVDPDIFMELLHRVGPRIGHFLQKSSATGTEACRNPSVPGYWWQLQVSFVLFQNCFQHYKHLHS